MDNRLYEHPVFTVNNELLAPEDRIRVTYERARLLVRTWNLSAADIVNCSRRFWEFHQDPVLGIDPALTNLMACHVNLFLGTLAAVVPGRPDLKPLLEKALKAEIIGNMFLTELGHGLDIQGLETVATKVKDGFMLNTPCSAATKFMSPTLPLDGIPRWGIVLSKLIVDGEDRGIHPFLIQTSDEQGMCPGVTNNCLPLRSGSMLDYSLTTFNNVHLRPDAFLGKSIEKPKDPRTLLVSYIWRIPVGTCAISMAVVNSGKILACIASDYSFRRRVHGPRNERIPIISFRTQLLPVLQAVAMSHVFEAWTPKVIDYFTAKGTSFDARTALGTVYKAAINRLVVQAASDLGERLGAQGLFPQNHLGIMEIDIRGNSISEGDVTVLCTRIFLEVILGRRQLPQPSHTDTLLWKRYASYVSTNKMLLASFSKGPRDDRVNALIFPQSESAIRALGHALAYSAALEAGVAKPLLDLFELAAMKVDALWYAEKAGITEATRMAKEDRAATQALPDLRKHVDELGIRPWVHSPLISDERWEKWLAEVKRDGSGVTGSMLKRSERLERMLARL